MQRKVLASLSLAALVALGTVSTAMMTPRQQRASAEPAIASVAQTTVAKSATWTDVAHSTDGSARIVVEDGVRYLELDESFSTDRGPDLFVLLHKQEIPSRYNDEDYVNLGRLERVSGTQRYLVPDGVDIESFESAVIWCRQFDVTFGYATFGS